MKELIDSGKLAIRSGVELSYLSTETQLALAELADDYSIDMKKSRLLRETADRNGNVSSAVAEISETSKSISCIIVDAVAIQDVYLEDEQGLVKNN